MEIRFGQRMVHVPDGAHLISSSFIGLLFFFNPVIYLFFLMCYGYTKISFKIVWRSLRVDVWFGIFKHKYYKCYIQTRRMDTLPSTSQTRDILITLRGLSSELIFFFLRNLKKNWSFVPEIIPTI